MTKTYVDTSILQMVKIAFKYFFHKIILEFVSNFLEIQGYIFFKLSVEFKDDAPCKR
jgi:hypothetical protein